MVKLSEVWQYFIKKTLQGKDVWSCKLCGNKYTHKNATKMLKHLQGCVKVPSEVKNFLKKNIKDQKKGIIDTCNFDMSIGTSELNATRTEPPVTNSFHSQVSSSAPVSLDTFVSNQSSTSTSSKSNISSFNTVNLEAGTSCNTRGNTESYSSTSTESKSGTLLKFLDQVPREKNDKIQGLLAKAIYASGAPLSLVEHPLWKTLFKDKTCVFFTKQKDPIYDYIRKRI